MDDIGSLPADIKKSCHISLKAFWNWSKIVLILEQNSGLDPKCQSVLKCGNMKVVQLIKYTVGGWVPWNSSLWLWVVVFLCQRVCVPIGTS